MKSNPLLPSMKAMEPGLTSSQKFVWMPTLKVWMLYPSQPSSTSAQSESRSTHQSKRKFSGDDINTKSSSKPRKIPHNPLSSCPICLGNDIHQTQLVALRLCMHQFCAKCIQRWSSLQRKCPLCKREFDGWFYDIQGPGSYREKRLLPLAEATEPSVNGNGQREMDSQRSLQYARGRILDNQRRTRPLPRRRFFGHSRFVSAAEKRRLEEAGAAEKALTWRASIYRKGLRAIPPRLQNRTNLKQNITDELNERARIERRLEPWIRRELEAILGDQDLAVLVHLVLSLWFSRLRNQEGTRNLIPSSNEDEFMQQLEPFLSDKANAFWHEPRYKCAPHFEYLQSGRATEKSDVYSFGVVLLELLSGKRPTGQSFVIKGLNVVGWVNTLLRENRLEEIVDTRCDCTCKESMEPVLQIILRCIASNPQERPTINQVVQMLEAETVSML